MGSGPGDGRCRVWRCADSCERHHVVRYIVRCNLLPSGHALTLNSGSGRWLGWVALKLEPGPPIGSPPLLQPVALALWMSGSDFVALDPLTGSERWLWLCGSSITWRTLPLALTGTRRWLQLVALDPPRHHGAGIGATLWPWPYCTGRAPPMRAQIYARPL
jgi:hypothetical protein